MAESRRERFAVSLARLTIVTALLTTLLIIEGLCRLFSHPDEE